MPRATHTHTHTQEKKNNNNNNIKQSLQYKKCWICSFFVSKIKGIPMHLKTYCLDIVCKSHYKDLKLHL